MKAKTTIFFLLLALLPFLSGCGPKTYSMESKPVTAISLDASSFEVHVGETWPLRVSFTPIGATSVIMWVSQDENIATVDKIGTVRGLAEGETTIWAITDSNTEVSASCTVKVLPPREPDVLVSSIVFSETSFELELGQAMDLSAYVTVSPDNATNPNLIWSSSSIGIVQATSSGRVTAMASGTATIRATAADESGVYASCTVTVPEKATQTGCCEGCTCGCGGSGTCSGCGGGGGGGGGGDDPAPDPDLVLFHTCDDFTYVHTGHMSGMTLQKLGRMQGSGYLERVVGGDNEIFIIARDRDVIDTGITNFAKGHMVFWFYIDDAAKLRQRAAATGRIEISDSNNPGHAIAWSSKTFLSDKVADGWNYIDLPFSESRNMATDGHELNLKAVNYFRIYFDGGVSSVELTYGLDALGFKEK